MDFASDTVNPIDHHIIQNLQDIFPERYLACDMTVWLVIVDSEQL